MSLKSSSGARNVALRLLTGVAALDRLARLIVCEFRFAPHLHAVRLSVLASLTGAGMNEFPFEIRQPAQHSKHQARPWAVVVSAQLSPASGNRLPSQKGRDLELVILIRPALVGAAGRSCRRLLLRAGLSRGRVLAPAAFHLRRKRLIVVSSPMPSTQIP